MIFPKPPDHIVLARSLSVDDLRQGVQFSVADAIRNLVNTSASLGTSFALMSMVSLRHDVFVVTIRAVYSGGALHDVMMGPRTSMHLVDPVHSRRSLDRHCK